MGLFGILKYGVFSRKFNSRNSLIAEADFMVLFPRAFDAVQKSCNLHERGCHGETRRFASGSRLTKDQFSGFAMQRLHERTT